MIKSPLIKLDNLIQAYKDSGAFVRLSDRSPKDAVVDNLCNRMHKRAKGEIKRFAPFGTSSPPPKASDLMFVAGEVCEEKEMNENMTVFIRSCSKAMMVTSGKEAMELLLNSERIIQDLKKATAYKHTLQIVVRQWATIDPVWEFRLFIMKGQLNGIPPVLVIFLIYQSCIKVPPTFRLYAVL